MDWEWRRKGEGVEQSCVLFLWIVADMVIMLLYHAMWMIYLAIFLSFLEFVYSNWVKNVAEFWSFLLYYFTDAITLWNLNWLKVLFTGVSFLENVLLWFLLSPWFSSAVHLKWKFSLFLIGWIHCYGMFAANLNMDWDWP